MRHITKLPLLTLALLALALLALSFAPSSASATSSRTTQLPTLTPTPAGEAAMPLLVWTMFNPWAMVIGGDSPRFALYDDGTVIYYTDKGYRSVQLGADELDALLDSLPLADFARLRAAYEASDWTDQPSSVFYLWQAGNLKGSQKMVYVYGDLRLDAVRDVLPAPLLAVYDTLVEFEHPDAEPWLPDQIEIMIWPYDTDEAADWPDDWPDLNDPRTVERHKDSYSLYLDAEYFEDFLTLMDESSGAARINGRTWAVSYRFPFPQEQLWMDVE